jgi:hypothetical protein
MRRSQLRRESLGDKNSQPQRQIYLLGR